MSGTGRHALTDFVPSIRMAGQIDEEHHVADNVSDDEQSDHLRLRSDDGAVDLEEVRKRVLLHSDVIDQLDQEILTTRRDLTTRVETLKELNERVQKVQRSLARLEIRLNRQSEEAPSTDRVALVMGLLHIAVYLVIGSGLWAIAVVR